MSIVVTPIPRLIDLAAPAFTLGTANAAGSAATAVASDSTLLAFDTTLPDAITFGQSGAVGSSTTAARRSHAHAMAALAVPLTAIDIDGGTDIGADIADADLFILDDAAGGNNRKSAASRLKTYIGERKMVRKTSDESVTSSNTQQDDDELLFQIAANEEWMVTVYGFVNGMNTGGMKMGWSVPTSCTFLSNLWLGGGDTGLDSAAVFAMARTGQGLGVNNAVLASHAGFILTTYIKNDSNAGTVNLAWAQQDSNGTATTLLAGSTLNAERIV
jgi:hypothetical protein